MQLSLQFQPPVITDCLSGNQNYNNYLEKCPFHLNNSRRVAALRWCLFDAPWQGESVHPPNDGTSQMYRMDMRSTTRQTKISTAMRNPISLRRISSTPRMIARIAPSSCQKPPSSGCPSDQLPRSRVYRHSLHGPATTRSRISLWQQALPHLWPHLRGSHLRHVHAPIWERDPKSRNLVKSMDI